MYLVFPSQKEPTTLKKFRRKTWEQNLERIDEFVTVPLFQFPDEMGGNVNLTQNFSLLRFPFPPIPRNKEEESLINRQEMKNKKVKVYNCMESWTVFFHRASRDKGTACSGSVLWRNNTCCGGAMTKIFSSFLIKDSYLI